MTTGLNDTLWFWKESKKHKTLFKIGNFWNYFKWKKTLDRSKSSLNYSLPWLNFQTISLLEKEIKPGVEVFEFGGGGSSLFFLAKGCKVTTIEHDEKWFEEIRKIIEKKSLTENWKGFLIKPETTTDNTPLDATNPHHYYTLSDEFKNFTFKNYASKIDGIKDASLDLVLVDGRSRPSCIYHSIKKIKKNGLLIIDNTERVYYSDYFLKNFSNDFELVLETYGPVPYITWFNKTTTWRKK
ncbi:MAG: hypothetical protein ABIP51_16965 [Bacteroidia bacterium]